MRLTTLLTFSLVALCQPSLARAADAGDDAAEDAPDAVGPVCSADGLSTVSAGTPASCAPYRCNPTTGLCSSSCASSADCASGDVCDSASNHCLPTTASCNGTTLVTVDGKTVDCSPYVCQGDVCLAVCVKDGDCATGNKCSSDGRCAAPTPASSNDSGCAMGNGRGSTGFLAALMLLGVAGRTRRRHRL